MSLCVAVDQPSGTCHDREDDDNGNNRVDLLIQSRHTSLHQGVSRSPASNPVHERPLAAAPIMATTLMNRGNTGYKPYRSVSGRDLASLQGKSRRSGQKQQNLLLTS